MEETVLSALGIKSELKVELMKINKHNIDWKEMYNNQKNQTMEDLANIFTR
jgi:hypothetical protein